MSLSTFHIQNQHLSVRINSKGAEMSSIRSGEIEYLWQADPAFWGRHAPILFPIVGRLVDSEYIYEDCQYKMGQHGFARDSEFILVEQTNTSITLVLNSTEETKSIYPFDFFLWVTYTLTEKKLNVEYKVSNPSLFKDLFFSIGAHPAFNCPFEFGQKRSDFHLEFDKKIAPKALIHNNGLYEGGTIDALSDGVLALPDTVFDKDSLTFNPNPFSKVTFVHTLTQKKYLSVSFQNFPYLGIWSKSDTSPFICIEPWHGIADHAEHNKDYTQKEGIKKLRPSNDFVCSFLIEII